MSLFISYKGYCRIGFDSSTISINHNQANQEEAQHQFLKLWLTKLYVSSLLQAPRTIALDQHSKPIILSSSSSEASSTWCKLPHSVERHMKMLVLIFSFSRDKWLGRHQGRCSRHHTTSLVSILTCGMGEAVVIHQ